MKNLAILMVAGAILVAGCSENGEIVDHPAAEAPSEHERGRAHALADLRADSPRYFGIGEPSSADSKLAEILSDEYGVTYVGLGCRPVPPVRVHARGYNEVVLNELNERFGKDIVKASWQKAQEQREQLRGKSKVSGKKRGQATFLTREQSFRAVWGKKRCRDD